jgi:dipeptidyl aminopeptidase/acylaminoacyl peptidase
MINWNPMHLWLAAVHAIRMGALMAVAATTAAACSATAPPQALAQSSPSSERRIEEITIRVRDGRTLRAVVSTPGAPGRYPVLVSVHGGQGDRPIDVMRDAAAPDSDSPTVQMFNRQNWIIVGPDFRNAWFDAEETDIVDAVDFARQLPNGNPERVAIFGGSNGGRLSLRASIMAPQSVDCVVAGSPFLTNPVLFFEGDPAQPPWSTASARAQAWMSAARERLRPLVSRGADASSLSRQDFLRAHSVEENAERIQARVLLLTSRADEQVPHEFVQGLIDRLRVAGNPAEVLTVEQSLHGFYWGREGDFGARAGRGERTPAQLEEEARVRQRVLTFLNQCLEE